MNLTEDFIAVQGILLSIEKSAGFLSKIKHRGGNEITIVNATTELHKLLSSKKYIENKQVNHAFDEQLKEICLFLILNTELKEPLNESSLQHLINIGPQVSPCLLANIIVALDLSRHYCQALLRFDLNIAEQFLVEMISIIKKCKPRLHLMNATEFLKFIIEKISVSSDSDGIEKLTDIGSQMLLNLTGLHGPQIENVKIDSVYECLGHTLLNLLDLLLLSNEKNKHLDRLIEKIIKTCCSIMMAVTLDVFCSWAEVQHQEEVLQILIAGKSYMFIERYQKHPHAKELISMLSTIAQKPKTVNELIFMSDVPKMISMINKANANQKSWFTALLNTQVLQCKDSIKCVDRWAHLCTLEDVCRLLNLSVSTKEPAARNVVIKCAATLEYKDLVYVTTRHFYQNGINNILNDNPQPQLILLFNKLKDTSIGDEFSKELHLLLLQNPQQTLTYVINECCKNAFYVSKLGTFWSNIKEIITINNFGMNILRNEITNNRPGEQNCKNYIQLINGLIQASVFSAESIVLNIILPLLQDAVSRKDLDLARYGLEILKGQQGTVFLNDNTECLFNFLLDLMKMARCNFSNFDGLRQEVVKLTVDVIEKLCEMNSNVSYHGQRVKSDDFFVSFYTEKIFARNVNFDVLAHFFPITFENHAETVAHLIKILPLCVTPEWVMLSRNLVNVCGVEKTIELLCDFMVLLCEVVNSQENATEEVKCMLHALAYCLQNVGIVIKASIQPRIKNLQEDVFLTRNICRLLKELPKGNLKSEEGLSLASLLSDISLKSLRPDKKFAILVASIHESHICKMLAQKILS